MSIPSDLICCNIVSEIYDCLQIERYNEVINLSNSQIKDISSLIFKNNLLPLEIDVFPKLLTFDGTYCIICKGLLKFRNLTKPNCAIIYDEHVFYNCKVFTKECTKCRSIHYPGYAVKDGINFYSLLWKKQWCLMSTTMTGFTLKFLKHTDVLTYRCNVSVTGRTDANSLENGTYSRLNLERNDRDAITKTRLEDCYKIYSFLNFCTRHMLHEEHYIKLQKNIDNEIIEIMPDMKQAFTRKAYDHHCDVNGCGTVLIFDADQKLTRKKCASKVGCKVMTVGDSNFKLEAKTGCIESPMQTSKLCKLCYEVYAEKTDCQELFLVDNIVDSKVDKKSKQKMYLVKWQGYSSNDNTWEPADNIPSILIEHYLKFGRCNISGDILRRKVINGTRMVEVKWNLDKSYDCTDNTWISCNSIDLIDESEVDETVKCNTSKTKKRFHARTAGILVGGFPCGHITLVDEIFGSESLTQVTGHVAQNIDYFSEINCLVYDDACHLKKFINKRFPEQRISALTMKCDRVHFKNHTDDWCKENCNPNTEKLLENVNTEKMEQLFSWLSSYSYMVRYMKQSTYSFFILDMLDKHNFVIDGVDPF